MKAIRASNIDFSYSLGDRKLNILKQFDVEIENGDLVAIQGPSGSGKSTLLYLLGGLLMPQAGRVEVLGREIYSMSENELAGFRSNSLGFVFQQFHLLPKLNVLDNILLPARYPAETKRDLAGNKEKAIKLAQKLGLGEHLNHRPNQLSGGQQQRVAICRSLLNDPDIILADEPTGNLDSRSAKMIIELLKDIHSQGKTVVIITHDAEVAAVCDRVIYMRDGSILESKRNKPLAPASIKPIQQTETKDFSYWRMFINLLPDALSNLWAQKSRAFLTMLGVLIGVASMLAMISFGQVTQDQVLSSYESMGVNKVVLNGQRNWRLRASDTNAVFFDEFSWEHDILRLLRVFPEIEMVSPVHINWNRDEVTSGGRSIQDKVTVQGIHPEFLAINQRSITYGRPMTPYHIESGAGVCLIGQEIAKELFFRTDPIGQVINVMQTEPGPFSCQVIGVLSEASSNNEWDNPNYHLYVPSSFFTKVSNEWYSRLSTAVFKIRQGADIEAFSKAAVRFFEAKYGRGGQFWVSQDAVMVSQLKQFLYFFKILLAAIAAVSLFVGGIGITNMMLASLSERIKEIGIRKAHGATNISLRWQYLLESLVTCTIAGVLGLILGFSAYQSIIYIAAKLVPQLEFEWVIVPWAFALSAVSIVIVGLGSGLVPAFRAERLQVIDALRSD